MPAPKLPDLVRMAVFLRDGGRCLFCRRKAAFRRGHVDHLTPRTWGGTDDVTNLGWTCRTCNGRKGSADLEAFAEMVFRYHYQPVATRYVSARAMVSAVREAAAQTVNVAVARAALAEEK